MLSLWPASSVATVLPTAIVLVEVFGLAFALAVIATRVPPLSVSVTLRATLMLHVEPVGPAQFAVVVAVVGPFTVQCPAVATVGVGGVEAWGATGSGVAGGVAGAVWAGVVGVLGEPMKGPG
jgi:hypothetical protein